MRSGAARLRTNTSCLAMEFSAKRRKVKILDYFSMIESNADKCQAQTDEARRDSIRATCNVCQKSISGTYRVKSNFITHLRKNHPDVYVDYQVKTGRFNMDDSAVNLSIASLDEPNHAIIGGLIPQSAHSSQMMAPRGDNYGPLVPRHMPTSTVKDPSCSGSPLGLVSDAQPVKMEPEMMSARSKVLTPQQAANEALMDFIIGKTYCLYVLFSESCCSFECARVSCYTYSVDKYTSQVSFLHV